MLSNFGQVSSVLGVAGYENASPPQVTNLLATTGSSSVINLVWDATPNTLSYSIRQNGPIIASGVLTPFYAVTGLGAGTTYTFTVAADNLVGEGLQSNNSFATTDSTNTASANGTTIPTVSQIVDSSLNIWTIVGGVVQMNGTNAGFSGSVVLLLYFNTTIYQQNSSANWWFWTGTGWQTTTDPRLVTGLSATGVSNTQINLSWTAVTGAITYNVYRNGSSIATNVSGTTYNDTGLTLGTTYTYTIAITSAFAFGPQSLPINGTTTGAVPAQVTGLTATAASSSQINLTWTADSGATTYNVYRNSSSIATGVTAISYNDTGLTASTSYTYNVAGVNTSGTGTQSTSVSATTSSGGAAVFGVKASGSTIISTLTGSKVQLRGCNFSCLTELLTGPTSPFTATNLSSTQTAAVVQSYVAGADLRSYSTAPIAGLMTAWKMNVVRIPLNESSYLRNYTGQDVLNLGPTVQPDVNGNMRSVVKQLVHDFNAAGMYVILDLHWTAPGPYLANTQMQMPDTDHTIAFWTQLGNDFGTNPAVIFELFNEPYPGAPNHGITEAATFGVLLNGRAETIMSFNSGKTKITYNWTSAGMQALLNAVRATGAINLCLIGGAGASTDLTGFLTANGGYFPVDSLNNSGAAWHSYGIENSGTTIENAAGSGTLNPTTTANQLITQGIPVVITECGATGDDPGMVYATQWADSNSFAGHALFWTFDNWGGSDPKISDSNGTPANGGVSWNTWTVNHT